MRIEELISEDQNLSELSLGKKIGAGLNRLARTTADTAGVGLGGLMGMYTRGTRAYNRGKSYIDPKAFPYTDPARNTSPTTPAPTTTPTTPAPTTTPTTPAPTPAPTTGDRMAQMRADADTKKKAEADLVRQQMAAKQQADQAAAAQDNATVAAVKAIQDKQKRGELVSQDELLTLRKANQRGIREDEEFYSSFLDMLI